MDVTGDRISSMKQLYAIFWAAGFLLGTILLVSSLAFTGCGEDGPKVGDPCDATDESFCKSDSVSMECSHVTRERTWIEIRCDEFCPSNVEGSCIEDEQGAHCECANE
jgi:hypothetical protein